MYQRACGNPRRGMEGKNERFPMANTGGKHGMGAIPPAKWSKQKLIEAVEEQDGLIQKLREQARADAHSRTRHKKINGPVKSPVVRTKSHSAAAATTIVIFGYIPWYSLLGVSTSFSKEWSPLFSSTEFVAVLTMLVTWVYSEVDQLFGRS